MRVRMILQAFPTDLPASFDDAMIKRENQKMCRFEKPQGSDRDEGITKACRTGRLSRIRNGSFRTANGIGPRRKPNLRVCGRAVTSGRRADFAIQKRQMRWWTRSGPQNCSDTDQPRTALGSQRKAAPNGTRLINSRSLVFELTLMLLRGYIFQKSYPSAQLFGNLPVDGSVAAHAVHCVVESVACPMDPCADADS
jgi:hypothetical protein